MNKWKFFCIFFSFFLTIEAQKPVIAIDLHWIAPNASTAKIVYKALFLAPGILWRHPSMLLHAYSIAKNAVELSKKVKGISNVLHELDKQLVAQGYGKLSSRELRKILSLAVTAAPNKEIIHAINGLKSRGYKVIAITNRDEHEFAAYKAHLKKSHKIDLEKYFDGFVCAPAYNSFSSTQGPFKLVQPNHFVAFERLPGESFLHTMRFLAVNVALGQIMYCVPTAYHSYFHVLEQLNQQSIQDTWAIKNFLFKEKYDLMQWLNTLL